MRAWIVLVGLVLVACGGSPTQPDSVPTTPETPVTAPAPTPDPAPTPAPPAPVPVPPTPDPTWTATTTFAHWFGPASVPDTFAVEWRYDTLWFGDLVATIRAQDGQSIFAIVRGTNATDYTSILVVRDGTSGTWTLDSPTGQARGNLTLK